MKPFPPNRLAGSAFSLVELLVAMSLLSFIVLGLLIMFNQTQRAFRESMTQTGVLEGARAVMDMITRDLQEVAPAYRPPLSGGQETYNFLAEAGGTGLTMDLPGTATTRTNVIDRFFFVTRNNQDFVGIGYKVQPDASLTGVGTLYRWSGTHSPRLGPFTLSQKFTVAANAADPVAAGCSRIADGIVHLRVTTYATNGYVLASAPVPPACFRVDYSTNTPPYARVRNTMVLDGPLGQRASYFVSNAVPAFVDVEIGVLEPQVLKRVQAMNATAAANYVSNHVAQVHIFHQRITIRNADYSAYQ